MIRSYIAGQQNIPLRARFPAIDAHNHLWGESDPARIVRTMDETGVVCYADLTANVSLSAGDGGYESRPDGIDGFMERCAGRFPDRFYCFTMAEFARSVKEPLFHDAGEFAADCVRVLHQHVARGARGLKVLKELGLAHTDADGRRVHADDERLSPIWEAAGDLGVPVLIHQSDPAGFFDPVTPVNEHYGSLKRYPSWSFAGEHFPTKADLLARRDTLVRRHPRTTFILPHVANYAENLPYVSQLLDANPNVMIDFSARLDEIGRQPYSAREFFIRYQDRILFGTDMPADLDSSVDMYRCYFRFLETYDEGFYTPDYDGTFNRARWTICGIGLPDVVLEKIYFRNALGIVPGLRETYQRALERQERR